MYSRLSLLGGKNRRPDLDDWLTAHRSITLVDFQLDAQNSYLFTYNTFINPLKPELNPICYLLALLGAHHFLHVSRIRVKLLTLT